MITTGNLLTSKTKRKIIIFLITYRYVYTIHLRIAKCSNKLGGIYLYVNNRGSYSSGF